MRIDLRLLRTSSCLPRLVLAWFALVLAVAGLAPIIHPTTMEIVCSAAGIAKIVVVNDDGQSTAADHHTLDCALCLAVASPPPHFSVRLALSRPTTPYRHGAVVARTAAPTGPPLPPRGPPCGAGSSRSLRLPAR